MSVEEQENRQDMPSLRAQDITRSAFFPLAIFLAGIAVSLLVDLVTGPGLIPGLILDLAAGTAVLICFIRLFDRSVSDQIKAVSTGTAAFVVAVLHLVIGYPLQSQGSIIAVAIDWVVRTLGLA